MREIYMKWWQIKMQIEIRYEKEIGEFHADIQMDRITKYRAADNLSSLFFEIHKLAVKYMIEKKD